MDTIYTEPINFLPPYQIKILVQILSETVDYNHKLMNIPAMWKKTMGKGVKVAVLDTGYPKHIDIQPVGGISFVPNYYEDQQGHGCVAPDTLIHTNFCGIETIEKLYNKLDIPEQVMSFSDGFQSKIKDIRDRHIKTLSFDVERGRACISPILYIHKTPVSGPVVHIIFEGGGTLDLTPWHPIPIACRNSHGDKYYTKVRADQLHIGDKIVIATHDEWISNEIFYFEGVKKWKCQKCLHTYSEKRPHCTHSEQRCPVCGTRNSLHSFIPTYPVTEDIAYLMGLIFTDGSISEKINGAITVASKDRPLIDEASRIAAKYGFGQGHIQYRNGCWHWRIYSKDLQIFLRNAGMRCGRNKKLYFPEFLSKTTKSIVSAFIAGLIDGDGCIYGNKSYIMVSTKTLANQLMILLNALQMRTSLSIAIGTTFGSINKQRSGKDMYYCRFSQMNPLVLGYMKHPIRKLKAEKLNPLYQREVYRIKKIEEKKYDGFYYDFTVENCHTYSANGIFVSNTHVSGIIAGTFGNNMGIAGIAPECSLWPVAVLGPDGSGTVEDIIKGIYWATDNVGVQVINMSLGIPAGAPKLTELEKACDYAVSKGSIIVAAAGNEGGAIGQPGVYDSVISVAAIDASKNRASFSDFGPEIDFAAGGVDVYSTYLNNGYAKLSGTSMATPAIAGLIALIMADHYKDNKKWLTKDEVYEKLRKIAYNVAGKTFDEYNGYGLPIFGNEGPIIQPTFA